MLSKTINTLDLKREREAKHNEAVYYFKSNLKSDKICIKQSKYSFNTIYKKQTGELNLFYKKYPLMKMVQALQIQDENCTISVETKVNTIFIIATTL